MHKKSKLLFLFFILSILISCRSDKSGEYPERINLLKYQQKKTLKLFLENTINSQTKQFSVVCFDSMVDGSSRILAGQCTLKKDDSDTTFGVSFHCMFREEKNEYYYKESVLHTIYPDKKMFSQRPVSAYNLEYNTVFNFIPGLFLTDNLNNYSIINAVTMDSLVRFVFTCNDEGNDNIMQLVIEKDTGVPREIAYFYYGSGNIKYSKTYRYSDFFIYKKPMVIYDYEKETEGFFGNKLMVFSPLKNKCVSRIPEEIVKQISNGDFNLTDYDGDVVLLDFWELFCSPCIKCLPKVNAMKEKYASFGFSPVGIISGAPEKGYALCERNGIKFQQATAPDTLYKLFNIDSFPRYLLLDKEGFVREMWRGYSSEIEIAVNKLLLE